MRARAYAQAEEMWQQEKRNCTGRVQKTITVGMFYCGQDMDAKYLKHLAAALKEVSQGMLDISFDVRWVVERWGPAAKLCRLIHGPNTVSRLCWVVEE